MSIPRISLRVSLHGSLLLSLLLAPPLQAQTTYRWVDKTGQVHYSDQPPPPEAVKNFEAKKLKGPNVIDTGGAFAYETGRASKKSPLTLYTADTCKEDCRQARDLLKQRGAPYNEKEIRTQSDADAFRQATGSQELFVPVLQAGGKTSKGFEEGAWNRLLDEAGYPARGDAKPPAAAPANPPPSKP